jgi:tRNA (guanine37-N1)-methyltransferase
MREKKVQDRVPATGIALQKEFAEKVRKLLKQNKLLLENLKPFRKNDIIVFPIGNPERAVETLVKEGVKAEIVESEFEKRKFVTREMLKESVNTRGARFWSSYLQVGDIAILNLKSEEELGDAKIFAEELVKHIPRIKSVYGKIGTTGIFRVPRLIHLYGEKKKSTIASEYGIKFYVDLGKVYYNPRLAEEHHRIAEQTSDEERVLDLFSGIGGFTLHIAVRHNTQILSNDANPYAIRCLLRSVYLNKPKIKASIYTSVDNASTLLHELSGKHSFERIIMNHPTRIMDFLPYVENILSKKSIVHAYALIDPYEIDKHLSLFREAFKKRKPMDIKYFRVLDYSPTHSIFRFDLFFE